MFTFLQEYRAVKAAIPDIIKVSGYRNDYIAGKMGISPAAFSVKKQRNTWNDNEMETLLDIIGNEAVESFVLLSIMWSRKKEEETITDAQFKAEMAA